jgi:acetyltransferase-like isoleucine patch superfamily enzyme
MGISKLAEIKNSDFLSNNVIIEDGAKLIGVHIKAKGIIIKSNAILTDCKLFSDGTATIGEGTVIKEHTIINAFKSISIGDRTIIDRDVFIGGMQSEKSQFKVGDDSVILYRSYLNTTREISIGNNVGIGGYCLIFTHSAWLNVLNGSPYKFARVEIKDNVWIPWNVTILPDIIIEKNVIVGGGSVVTKNLPPGVFAAGIPAKVIRKREISSLSNASKNAIMLEILSDFQGYITNYLKLVNARLDDSESVAITFESGRRLLYTLDFRNIRRNDIVISFQIPSEVKRENDWIELDTLTSNNTNNNSTAKNFIEFVRRYGIKIRSG